MISAIIVMAGKGSRMKSDLNKVLHLLGEKPIFKYSLDVFLKKCDEVVLVINKEEENIVKKYIFDPRIKIAYGGNTRTFSVYNGLKKAKYEYVLIHDAARPFIDEEIIDNCIKQVKLRPFFVGVPCINTIRERHNNEFTTLKRDNLYEVQTPQGGEKQIFIEAFNLAIKDNYMGTDDISIIEKYTDKKIDMIIGKDTNFKITTQFDLKIARFMVGEKND